jgi:acyl-CoA thioesterase-2
VEHDASHARPGGDLSESAADIVQRFLAMLELERLDRDLFRAWNPPRPEGPRQALFGGQVAAHALRAAAVTIEAPHYPHSLHGYFLRPGRDDAHTVLRVDRIRDGKSFSTRTVVAMQDGEAIFSLTASFHRDEPGAQFATPIAPDVPAPDELLASGVAESRLWGFDTPFERLEVPQFSHAQQSAHPRRAMWVRMRSRLPDDRNLHACVLTYISDMGVVGAVRAALGRLNEHGMGASLDHALWFHRHARADEWLLFDVASRSNAGSRGLGVGSLHTVDGLHAVTIGQEALVRLPD